jgi:hypothetical protein
VMVMSGLAEEIIRAPLDGNVGARDNTVRYVGAR